MSDDRDDDDEGAPNRADAEIIREAKARFKRCEDWEATARQRFIEDVKFVNGDAYNMYQWPESVRSDRGYGTGDERPCVTVNKTQQHCFQVINDARQNKTSIKIKPVGNEATYEAAQVWEGIVRHIEYISDAPSAYIHATTFQVQGGIGYLRLVTDYAGSDTMDQEIYIRAVKDPLSVYVDPDFQQPDGMDKRFAFVFIDMPNDEFRAKYPKHKNIPHANGSKSPLGNSEGWITEKHTRVAEYCRRVEVKDRLIVFTDPETGEEQMIKASKARSFPGKLRQAYLDQLKDPTTKSRAIVTNKVEWFKIAGDVVLERTDWAGQYVPIVAVVGIETVIDGQLDRKGHVRALLDPQRLYNYNNSAAIEFGALQGKQPWVAGAKAIEGYETYYDTANRENYSVLLFNDYDDEGHPLQAPSRSAPPMSAPVYLEGMKQAAEDMMLVSGQYQAMMGEPSNEKSGKAIQARQRQGENATYHFIDHQAMAIRTIGKMIIDIGPKIYDTARVIKIMGEDGSDTDIRLDPDAEKAYEKRKAETNEAAEQVIMNPTIGRYDVMSDVGPDYATRRQEAFNALSQIAMQNPELMAIIGDLVMLAADFPLADEAAERLKRMVPAQALGEQNPQLVQMQQQMQAGGQLMQKMAEKLTELQAALKSKDEQKDVNVYKAITDRLEVFMKAIGTPADMTKMWHQLAMQEHANSFDNIQQSNQADIDSGLMAQGAGHDADAAEQAAQNAPGPAGASA